MLEFLLDFKNLKSIKKEGTWEESLKKQFESEIFDSQDWYRIPYRTECIMGKMEVSGQKILNVLAIMLKNVDFCEINILRT